MSEELFCGCGGKMIIGKSGFGPVNRKPFIRFYNFKCEKCNGLFSINAKNRKQAIAAFKKATRFGQWISVEDGVKQYVDILGLDSTGRWGKVKKVGIDWVCTEFDIDTNHITHCAEINLPEEEK
jgi:hypothetical protein